MCGASLKVVLALRVLLPGHLPEVLVVLRGGADEREGEYAPAPDVMVAQRRDHLPL